MFVNEAVGDEDVLENKFQMPFIRALKVTISVSILAANVWCGTQFYNLKSCMTLSKAE